MTETKTELADVLRELKAMGIDWLGEDSFDTTVYVDGAWGYAYRGQEETYAAIIQAKCQRECGVRGWKYNIWVNPDSNASTNGTVWVKIVANGRFYHSLYEFSSVALALATALRDALRGVS